jgi:hypothetical protein
VAPYARRGVCLPACVSAPPPQVLQGGTLLVMRAYEEVRPEGHYDWCHVTDSDGITLYYNKRKGTPTTRQDPTPLGTRNEFIRAGALPNDTWCYHTGSRLFPVH